MKHADSSKRQDEYARNRAFRQGKSGVMNSDIRLSVGFWQHPKTKKTARRLGLEGIRSLQILWAWAAVNRPDGNLSGMDWEDIELAADWQGEEQKFFDTCLGMWIDETSDGYALHDWQEHNPWASEADTRSDAARLSRFARKFPEIAKSMRDDGVKGLTQEEYRMYADGTPYIRRNTNVDTALNERSADRSTPAPSPTPNVKEESVLNAHARVERPAENPEPEAVLSRQHSLAFDEFFEAFPEQHRGGRSEAAGEWVALESNRALPGLPRILDALGQWEDSEAWKRQGGRYIPTAANFLKREYWLRKPPEPAEQGGNGEQARPRVATVAQQRVQDNDDMAKMLLQARRAQHAQPGLHASTAGQSGAALPASR